MTLALEDSMSNSRIYKELTQNEIQAIIIDAFGSAVNLQSYTKTDGGLFNTSYFVETANPNQKLILRIAPVNQDLLLDYEKTMMKSEPVINEMIRSAGIPTAKIIQFNDRHNIIDRDYIILEYIDSINSASPLFPKEYNSKIMRELGVYTRKIHSIKSDRFGFISPDGTAKGNYTSWFDALIDQVNEIVAKASDYHLLDEENLKAFYDFFMEHKSVFSLEKPNYDSRPCLVHNDLWAPNILVNNSGGEWKVAAVIDADRALFADYEYEFVLWKNDSDFMESYGIPLDFSENGKLKRHGYSMLHSLVNAYVYKIQYADKIHYELEKDGLIEKISSVI